MTQCAIRLGDDSSFRVNNCAGVQLVLTGGTPPARTEMKPLVVEGLGGPVTGSPT